MAPRKQTKRPTRTLVPKTKPMEISSKEIMRALERRHIEDVFVPECKTGSSSEPCPRLDAWVMARSWKHPMVIGYEVKASRKDFLRDTKWHEYLPYCNQLYFACPWGLLDPAEMPGGVGLVWMARNLSTVVVKKKAEHREIVVPENLYRYVLMARVQISREDRYHVQSGGPLERAQKRLIETEAAIAHLNDKQSTSLLGHLISNKLRTALRENIEKVANRNRVLEIENANLEAVKAIAKTLDISVGSSWTNHDNIKRAFDNYEYQKTCRVEPTSLRRLASAALELAEAVENNKTGSTP